MTPFDVLGVHGEVVLDAPKGKGGGDLEVDGVMAEVKVRTEQPACAAGVVS